ncbi:MAG: hypothetical protein ACM37U_07680 [Gemmatimonas sp.]
MRRRRTLGFLGIARRNVALVIGVSGIGCLCAAGSVARAQAGAPKTWGFVSTRLDSRSSNGVYTGYGYGSVFVVGALLDNRRSGYGEQLIGVGARGHLGGAGSQFVIAAVAKAPESRYLQFYYLPTIAYRGLTVGTTLIGYVPLDPTGFTQLLVTPLTALVQTIGPVSLGASYDMNAEQHAATRHDAGPMLRVALPSAEVGAELLLGIRNASNRLRLSFRAFY